MIAISRKIRLDKIQTMVQPILVGLCLVLFSISGWSLALKKDISHFKILGDNIEVLMDPDRQYTITNVPFSSFERYQKVSPNFGFYDGVVWMKLKLSSEKQKRMLLELKNPNLDFVTIYEKSKNGYLKIADFGDGYSFDQREVKHRFFQVEIDVPNEIVIRVDNLGDQCFVPIHLFDKAGLQIRDFSEQFLWGVYFSLLLFVLGLSIAVYKMLRKISTFYYLCYLLSLLITQISFSGFGFQYLWSNSSYFANRSLPMMGTLSAIFSLLFAMSFFKTKKFNKKSHHFFNFAVVVLLINVYLSLSPFDLTYKMSVIIVNLSIILLSIAMLPVAVKGIRRGFKPAVFYLLSFSLLFVWILVFVLRNFGVLPGNVFTEYSLQFGTGIEVILLTFAVIQEFKALKEKAFESLENLKTMKEQQSLSLERQIESRTKELLQNKLDIEYKNEKVLSSIKYARGIQDILISDETNFISPYSSGFVFNAPKDIVSGDFQWNTKIQRIINEEKTELEVFCVADCTGHGVPGALISVLSIRILKSIVKNPEIKCPVDILSFLQREFNELFKLHGANLSIQDGMDCVVCVYNPKTMLLQMAGAKNGLYHVRDGDLTWYRGDKFEIGGNRPITSFVRSDIQLQKGDKLYLTTDGFADQFGGKDDKKIKREKLKNLILDNVDKSMEEQKRIYTIFFNEWKGENEQTDDVCLIGLEI
jgi:two-component system, sensor histidine kinase LadS